MLHIIARLMDSLMSILEQELHLFGESWQFLWVSFLPKPLFGANREEREKNDKNGAWEWIQSRAYCKQFSFSAFRFLFSPSPKFLDSQFFKDCSSGNRWPDIRRDEGRMEKEDTWSEWVDNFLSLFHLSTFNCYKIYETTYFYSIKIDL